MPERFEVDDEVFEEFVRLSELPLESTERLQRLAERPSPFAKGTE